ncbi:MAG TPA: hypothetical protein VHO24_03290, partial [Opitutaceae bacterium]|nr:hypothetical protein [Opitutaceae bacterium]
TLAPSERACASLPIWNDVIGQSWSLNAATDEATCSPVPNHIVIDLKRRVAVWHGRSKTGSVCLK